ncbi:MAG: AI-2E family transporter [Ruminococcaceae bacterium]|nr:AI-2E family transporter [Oscillospiraceae bacterium]
MKDRIKMKTKEKKQILTWNNCFKVGVSLFVLFLCIHYWSPISKLLSDTLKAASPIFIGFAIAYVINLLMNLYEKIYFPKHSDKKIVYATRRPICLTLTLLTFAAVIALLIWIVVPELVQCISFLIAEIPPLIQKLLKSEWIRDIVPSDILSTLTSIDWLSYVEKIIGTVGNGIGSAVSAVVTFVTSTLSVIVTIFISLIFSMYMLIDKEKFFSQTKRMCKNYLSGKHFEKISHISSVVNNSFRRYIVGQFTEAIILGVLCSVGMLIFKFPYAGMIGALIGFTALIPVAGAYIGAGVGAVMILTVSPIKALLFLLFILVLQQLEGNLIYPKVVGNSLGLPALWVLAAVTVGGTLMGMLGMLIGVPIAAAIYQLIREDLHNREKKALLAESAHTIKRVRLRVKEPEDSSEEN